ncbi:hypothetical protein H4S04_002618 [Coemansia sp. S16]|nr:hypothetical protein H4S04_002618 [Coemansia sp. S16]KAJ2066611.1 hypothetical protein GGI08_001785 [Coemansia sp. S2]KAJ2071091.1 hypothetical protein GGH13_003588 [Coemansia sp. S155-1]KAJ2352017.1 hypothetical protein GGH92_001506 [Coemansia sp. RSA 2673]
MADGDGDAKDTEQRAQVNDARVDNGSDAEDAEQVSPFNDMADGDGDAEDIEQRAQVDDAGVDNGSDAEGPAQPDGTDNSRAAEVPEPSPPSNEIGGGESALTLQTQLRELSSLPTYSTDLLALCTISSAPLEVFTVKRTVRGVWRTCLETPSGARLICPVGRYHDMALARPFPQCRKSSDDPWTFSPQAIEHAHSAIGGLDNSFLPGLSVSGNGMPYTKSTALPTWRLLKDIHGQQEISSRYWIYRSKLDDGSNWRAYPKRKYEDKKLTKIVNMLPWCYLFDRGTSAELRQAMDFSDLVEHYGRLKYDTLAAIQDHNDALCYHGSSNGDERINGEQPGSASALYKEPPANIKKFAKLVTATALTRHRTKLPTETRDGSGGENSVCAPPTSTSESRSAITAKATAASSTVQEPAPIPTANGNDSIDEVPLANPDSVGELHDDQSTISEQPEEPVSTESATAETVNIGSDATIEESKKANGSSIDAVTTPDVVPRPREQVEEADAPAPAPINAEASHNVGGHATTLPVATPGGTGSTGEDKEGGAEMTSEELSINAGSQPDETSATDAPMQDATVVNGAGAMHVVEPPPAVVEIEAVNPPVEVDMEERPPVVDLNMADAEPPADDDLEVEAMNPPVEPPADDDLEVEAMNPPVEVDMEERPSVADLNMADAEPPADDDLDMGDEEPVEDDVQMEATNPPAEVNMEDAEPLTADVNMEAVEQLAIDRGAQQGAEPVNERKVARHRQRRHVNSDFVSNTLPGFNPTIAPDTYSDFLNALKELPPLNPGTAVNMPHFDLGFAANTMFPNSGATANMIPGFDASLAAGAPLLNPGNTFDMPLGVGWANPVGTAPGVDSSATTNMIPGFDASLVAGAPLLNPGNTLGMLPSFGLENPVGTAPGVDSSNSGNAPLSGANAQSYSIGPATTEPLPDLSYINMGDLMQKCGNAGSQDNTLPSDSSGTGTLPFNPMYPGLDVVPPSSFTYPGLDDRTQDIMNQGFDRFFEEQGRLNQMPAPFAANASSGTAAAATVPGLYQPLEYLNGMLPLAPSSLDYPWLNTGNSGNMTLAPSYAGQTTNETGDSVESLPHAEREQFDNQFNEAGAATNIVPPTVLTAPAVPTESADTEKLDGESGTAPKDDTSAPNMPRTNYKGKGDCKRARVRS